MFAIAFDMVVSDLKKIYGYLTERNDMANLYRAIEALKKTDWFRDSVRDIRAFKVEDWSDFTPVFKEQ